MVTRKEEKNTSSSLPAGPPGGSPAGPAAASPSPTPSQLRPAAGTDQPGTDLGPRAAPTPGGQGQGRRASLHQPSRPEPRDQMAKFRAGSGPARLSQPLALPHLPGPPWCAPCPAGPCAPGPWTVPTWSPLTPRGHGSGSRSPGRERGGETPQGVGRKEPRNAHPRAHVPARGKAARGVGTPPGSRTPGRAGTQWPRGPAAGRGQADSRAASAGRGPPPGLPSARPAHRVQWPLGTRWPLGCDAGRGSCPRGRWSVQSGSPSPPPPGF